MKKHLLTKTFLFLAFLIWAQVGWGQQVIGTFPGMDGGFENQTGTLSTASTVSSAQTNWTTQIAGAGVITNTGGRSGPKYVTYTQSGTTHRKLQTPTDALTVSTSYVVQFYYQGDLDGTISGDNLRTAVSAAGTSSPGTYSTYLNSVNTGSVWTKFTAVVSTSGTTATVGLGLISVNNTAQFKIDDYVLYLGSSEDVTAPNSPGAVTVDNATGNSLDVSWVASDDVDGGGYVVVRFASDPGSGNDPNQNGIYAVGNDVPTGGTVRYIGTSTSFTDNVGLNSGTQYWYKVYTVDKAFNYSDESSGNGTTTVDVTAPIWTVGYPQTANVAKIALDLVYNMDETGTAYYVVLANGANAPSSAQVKAGQDDTGTLVALSGSKAIDLATTEYTSNIVGLTAGTDYDIFGVAEDAVPNIQDLAKLVDATTVALSTDATITSGVYAVDNGSETITDVPGSETLATFEGNLTPATYASFETYESDGTTVATDLQTGYKVIVTAEAGNTKTYVVTLSTLSDAKDILTYSFAEQTGAATISDVTHTVDIEVLYGTDVTTLVATFTISANASAAVGATPQVSETTPNDFTSPVVYTITAEDASTQNWTVTVTEAAPSTDATVSSTVYTVDNGLETIIDIPYYETLAAFEASITPAAYATFETYESDGLTVATDLQSGYKVIGTAQDGTTTKTYIITLDAAPAADLFFSEYIEGSSNNKAIEIYNGTGSDVDLSNYSVELYGNGSATPTGTLALTGILANGEVYVIANSSASASILDVKDITSAVTNFNGDDALGLLKSSVLIDVFGTIGSDPGSSWAVAGTGGATADHTLVRKNSIVAGTTDWASSAGTTADNSQWIVSTVDDFTYLAWHIAKSTKKDILSFSLAEQTGAATINDVAYTVDIEVAKGTVVTALVPTITVSNRASVSPASGVAQDFTSPVTYTVTAQDATTQDWTATLTIYKSNDATVSSGVYTVDNGLSTITNVPFGTTLATFEGNITPATDATFETYEADGTTVATDLQDGYKVIGTAEDGITTKTYTITVTPASTDATISSGVYTVDNGLETITNIPFSETLATFEGNLTPATFAGFETYESDGTTVAADLQTGYKVIVTAQAGNTKTYTVTKNAALSDAKDILTYSFAEQTAAATISDVTHTVAIEVAYGTNVTNLVATFTISAGATIAVGATPQLSETTPNDFTSPVVYTVTAEDASTQDWTVTVTEEAPSTVATISSGAYTIDNGLETITDVPYNETLATFEGNLTPAADATFETYQSDGTTVATNLASGYKVIVTAQDGTTTKTYVITLLPAPLGDLFFSEYIEGGGSNKAIEIYNGTGSDVDLSDYTIKQSYSGEGWGIRGGVSDTRYVLPLSGTLANGDVLVIASSAANAGILAAADLTFDYGAAANDCIGCNIPYFGGDDALGLFKTGVLIDQIGVETPDPGTGWDVAGVTLATVDHTLIRKDAVVEGSTDWASIAGIDEGSSEYIVYPKDYIGGLGSHKLAMLSAETDILTYTVPDQLSSTVNATDHTVRVYMTTGTDVSALVPTITVSAGATISPLSGVAQNLSTSKTYIVTAEGGNTQSWGALALFLNNDATLSEIQVVGVPIDGFVSTTYAYIVDLPFGTTATPVVTYTKTDVNAGAVLTPATNVTSATAADRTTTISVTAEDGVTTQDYTVLFNVTPGNTDATLSDLQVDALTVAGFVSTTYDYIVDLPFGTTAIPVVTATENDPNANAVIVDATDVTSTTAANRTTTITVIAEDGSTQLVYTVLFNVTPGNTDAMLSDLTVATGTLAPVFASGTYAYTVSLPFGSTATPAVTATENDPNANAVVVDATNVTSATDADRTTTITVTAEDGSTQLVYTVLFNVTPPLTGKSILTYSFAEQTGAATIGDGTIDIEVNNTTNRSNLVATFTISDGASVAVGATPQVSGTTANDFTNPVTYVVTAQDATTKDWIVTVTNAVTLSTANNILTFSVLGVNATVNSGDHTVTATLPYGTNRSAMVATYTLSTGASAKVGATIQVSGTTQNDFTSPVVYSITAEDGTSTQDWTVTINIVPPATDATLSDLTVGGTAPTDFAATTYDYIVELPFGTTATPVVAATENDANANAVVVDATDVTSTTAANRTTTITVTAEDGTTQLVYTVLFNVYSGNTDATLSDLKVDATTITGFSSTTYTYFYNLPYGTTATPVVTATANDVNANALVVQATDVTSTTAAERTTTVTVTAQDVSVTQDYTIQFYVLLPNTDARVSSTVYNVNNTYNIINMVPSGTTLATFESNITPATEGSFETYQSDSVTLATDLESGYVLIGTAQDGTTTKIYTIKLIEEVVETALYEGFDYANGAVLQTQTGWTPLNTGDDLLIATGNLSYAGLKEPTGNKVTFAGGGIDAYYAFDSVKVGTVYASFIFKVTDQSVMTDLTDGGYFAALADNTTSYDARIWVRPNPAAASSTFDIGFGNVSSSPPTTTGTYNLGDSVFVVMSYTIANGEVSAWINPSSASFGGTAPVASITGTDGTPATSISKFLIRQDSPEETPIMEFDELRIGTTWADVTPRSSSATPEAEILSFELAEQTGDAVIDSDLGTIDIEVLYGTDVTYLAPTIEVSNGAMVMPESDVAQDFTAPVVYNVTASDYLTTKDWTVTVDIAAGSEEAEILTFDIATSDSVKINSVDTTITVYMPFGTNVAALTPIFTISEYAIVDIASNTVQNFTAPFTYTVTAQNGTNIMTWEVTVIVAATASTDATLSDLTVDGITVEGFDPATFSYNVVLPVGTTDVPIVAAVENDLFANAVPTQATNLTGTEAERSATVLVTAQDATTTKLYTIIFTVAAETGNLIISEYIEGGGSNKAIELFNPGSTAVDLSQFEIKQSHDGTGWGVDGIAYVLPLEGTLAAGQVYVIANGQAVAAILDVADTTFIYSDAEGHKVPAFNGNDALGLFKNGVLVDVIGVPTESVAWNVGDTLNATTDNTLVRKYGVTSGTTDWAASAGTTAANSQWIVYGKDYLDNIGLPTPLVNTAPAITAVTLNPTNPTTNQAVVVTATITDNSVEAVDLTVALLWGTAAGSETNSVTFAQVGFTNEFTGTIPAAAVGTIYYKITASDGSMSSEHTGSYNVIATGINDPASFVHMSIYPNPNNGQFTLELNAKKAGKFDIQIVNVIGQVVYQKQIDQDGTYKDQIDITDQAKGLYYIRINDGTSTKVQKLMIQ